MGEGVQEVSREQGSQVQRGVLRPCSLAGLLLPHQPQVQGVYQVRQDQSESADRQVGEIDEQESIADGC